MRLASDSIDILTGGFFAELDASKPSTSTSPSETR